MDGIKHTLVKQKQLLEIELGEYNCHKKQNITSIHPDTYYQKVLALHKLIKCSIDIINSMSDDIYQGVHLEQ